MPAAWDTSLASQLHPRARYSTLLATFTRTGAPVVVTAPTAFQTIHGIARQVESEPAAARILEWYETLFAGPLVQVLAVDGQASALAGKLRARHPFPPPSPRADARTKPDRRVAWVIDILIAATAWTAGYGIATNNYRDFAVLRDLIAELYPSTTPLAVGSVPTGPDPDR